MTDSWYIIVDRTVCPNYLHGMCNAYNVGASCICRRDNCIMCIIEKKDLLKNEYGNAIRDRASRCASTV